MRDSPVPARSSVSREAVIGVRGLEAGFGDRIVLRGVDLDLYRGEILGVVGASGSGKSVLLRSLLSLMPKRAGTIEIFGVNVEDMPFEARRQLEQRLGVLFQFGALISSITVKENVQLMMREHLRLSEELLDEIAILKLEMVGLAPDTGEKYPSELSGGMVKRAALARTWHGRWRSIRRSCSSTSPLRASIRSARASSTSSSRRFAAPSASRCSW